jgi:hypothetical protein
MTFGRHIGATWSLCGAELHGRPARRDDGRPEQSATRVGGTVPRPGTGAPSTAAPDDPNVRRSHCSESVSSAAV